MCVCVWWWEGPFLSIEEKALHLFSLLILLSFFYTLSVRGFGVPALSQLSHLSTRPRVFLYAHILLNGLSLCRPVRLRFRIQHLTNADVTQDWRSLSWKKETHGGKGGPQAAARVLLTEFSVLPLLFRFAAAARNTKTKATNLGVMGHLEFRWHQMGSCLSVQPAPVAPRQQRQRRPSLSTLFLILAF